MTGETRGKNSNYRIKQRGAVPEQARAAMVLIHGRGSSASDILALAPHFGRDDLLYLAPEAPSGQWYPLPFTAPLERNEPGISNGMLAIDDAFALLDDHGFGPERTVLLGFSQGACLALEYAARHARRYGGVAGLSGGLIGPDGTPRTYPGSLEGTPVFLGCSDVDAHIALHRVHEARDVFERLGAAVTERIYPGMAHTIDADELAFVQQMLAGLTHPAR
jgi:predicted esterase